MSVDFEFVPEKQQEMHGHLINWGLWCNSPTGSNISPMFRFYRSSKVYAYMEQTAVLVDVARAVKIAKAVIKLPEDFRHALSWYYINKGSPARACRIIGCNMKHLARLVTDGRTMLINRRA